jgi:hypothetical protein
MSRIAGVWHVHALHMRPLGELRDRERVIRLKVSIAKAGQFSARISRIEHQQKRIFRTPKERHAPLPVLGALTQEDSLD